MFRTTLESTPSFAVIAVLVLALIGCQDKAPTSAGVSASPDAAKPAPKAATEPAEAKELTIYCGRKQKMLEPLLKKFGEDHKVEVKVQYAKSAQLAATLIEEGDKSPADVFFAQDVSTLGFLDGEGKLAPLEKETLERVPAIFRSKTGNWVGTSGRARVLAYNVKGVSTDALPKGIDDLLEPKWKGKVGWAPENASFQSFVAALVAERGEEKTAEWLKAMVAQEPKAYPSNTPMVTAVGNGEILVALTNHYYLFRLKKEHGESFAAANHYLRNGKAGSLVNAAGVGVLKTSPHPELARELVAWLLSDETQNYFATQTYEFPLAAGVKASDKLPALHDLKVPATDLGALGDLKPTIKLLRAAGALE